MRFTLSNFFFVFTEKEIQGWDRLSAVASFQLTVLLTKHSKRFPRGRWADVERDGGEGGCWALPAMLLLSDSHPITLERLLWFSLVFLYIPSRSLWHQMLITHSGVCKMWVETSPILF